MKHWDYLKYVLRHKYYVVLECFGVGLYWRGIKHDWHKFLPSEWFPYVEFFHGKNAKPVRDKVGYYKPTDTDDKFDMAWLMHQKRADHHWQWWICPQDSGGFKTFPMSREAVLEMLCDWCGASMAQGHGRWSGDNGVFAWYTKNGSKMILHPDTRKQVELLLVQMSH
jgi:hypothetical protein